MRVPRACTARCFVSKTAGKGRLQRLLDVDDVQTATAGDTAGAAAYSKTVAGFFVDHDVVRTRNLIVMRGRFKFNRHICSVYSTQLLQGQTPACHAGRRHQLR